MIGKLKFFNGVKGYGFITVDGGRDVFFHYSRLLMTNTERKKLKDKVGAELVFDEQQGPKGSFAADVRFKGAAEVPA